jgi:hypothetical protein
VQDPHGDQDGQVAGPVGAQAGRATTTATEIAAMTTPTSTLLPCRFRRTKKGKVAREAPTPSRQKKMPPNRGMNGR